MRIIAKVMVEGRAGLRDENLMLRTVVYFVLALFSLTSVLGCAPGAATALSPTPAATPAQALAAATPIPPTPPSILPTIPVATPTRGVPAVVN
ncbi:MAG: hypothetical protein HYR71_05475, partial [Chloroflexi bacterium]|nr:hypothetical protein [Chloroflexota bacterium]